MASHLSLSGSSPASPAPVLSPSPSPLGAKGVGGVSIIHNPANRHSFRIPPHTASNVVHRRTPRTTHHVPPVAFANPLRLSTCGLKEFYLHLTDKGCAPPLFLH